MQKVKVKKSHPDARLPTQSLDDVGFDLYAVKHTEIPPRGTAMVKTGLVLAADPGNLNVETMTIFGSSRLHAQLRSLLKIEGRSGMAFRGVWPVGGIIDPGYRGEMNVILYNSTMETYHVGAGDRCAQLVWYLVNAPGDNMSTPFEWVEEVEETERGEDGFGSTGD